MKNKGLLKVSLIGMCVILLWATLLASACTPTPVEATKILFASPSPPTEARVAAFEAWAQELEERTDGKYTVEFSYGGALGPMPEYYNFAADGVCDISVCMPTMIKGRFPLSEIATLPWVFTSAKTGAEALWKFYEKGYLDNEYADAKPLFLWMGEGSGLFTANKPINTLADLEGLKIRCSGGTATDTVGALGATPVFFPITEVYGVLEKGTVDGAFTNHSAVATFNLQEVLSYRIEPALTGSSPWLGVMNKNTYDNMPKDVKAVVDDMIDGGKYGLMLGGIDENETVAGREVFRGAGGEYTEWSAADLATMDGLLAPIWAKWITDTEAQGLPAREALDELYNILKGLGVEKPAIGYTP